MKKQYDVIIVGTGVAGLFCALHLPETCNILMITKDALDQSNSYLAQGGICVLKDQDDFKSYVADTMRAGRFENDKIAVATMIQSSREVINELIHYHVDFDKVDGKLVYTKEAAHSTNRILHHKDITGREITSKLLAAVKEKTNVELVPYCTLLDIIKDSKKVKGVVVNCEDAQKTIKAPYVVLATGGIGGLFIHSTNFRHITGDGVAIAIKNDITVKDIHYIQIHPTTLYSQKDGRRFLISEAVRGEGAYLVNSKGERFVDELLPRDVVSGIISNEMQKEGTDHVYLSLKHLDADYIKARFPNISKACEEEGYDLARDLVPVTPAQHYFMGGIKVDLNGRTSLNNLFAVGETSCTGVHGANRLASNSLLEGLVFAKRAAEEIIRQSKIMQVVSEENIEYNECLDVELVEEKYKHLLLETIKREDEDFYVRWCHEKYKCG
ncbi:L-aspartate oxidase [Cellulosilyticum ruminicola]|uniref:L-aspartate oxidase n=1 Tax=Cellulosilyticum ruminicola TaxID=425254 RepID=UPI0006D1421F